MVSSKMCVKGEANVDGKGDEPIMPEAKSEWSQWRRNDAGETNVERRDKGVEAVDGTGVVICSVYTPWRTGSSPEGTKRNKVHDANKE